MHLILSHVLTKEFPELAQRITDLKTHSPHFASLLDKHDDLDKQITVAEEHGTAISDLALETLKKSRLHLKDELYKLATQGA
jgi:uncharacterized protein YdcH (DUF465 family)